MKRLLFHDISFFVFPALSGKQIRFETPISTVFSEQFAVFTEKEKKTVGVHSFFKRASANLIGLQTKTHLKNVSNNN